MTLYKIFVFSPRYSCTGVLFAFFQQKTGNFSKNLAFWKQVCYIHTSVKNMTKEAVPCLEASTS